MRARAAAIAALLFLLPHAALAEDAPAAAGAAVMPAHIRRFTTWDLNLEGGGGAFLPDSSAFGFGRVRGGILWVRDPIFFSLGLTYDASNRSGATFGVQGEVMHLETGLWLQAGAAVDVIAPSPVFNGSVGWSLFGLEAQYRDFPTTSPGFALFAKLRIPIGIIAQASRK